MKDYFIIATLAVGTLFLAAIGVFYGLDQYQTNGIVQDINRTARTSAVINTDNSVRADPGVLTVSRSAFERAFAARFLKSTDTKLDPGKVRYQFDYLFTGPIMVPKANGSPTGDTKHKVSQPYYETGSIRASDLANGTYKPVPSDVLSDTVPIKAIRVHVTLPVHGSDQTFQGTVVANAHSGQ